FLALIFMFFPLNKMDKIHYEFVAIISKMQNKTS
ncbi:hypothetical protein GEW_01396, partial [Pasteurella multocida subsp. gallicida str. Anand1_poultry]